MNTIKVVGCLFATCLTPVAAATVISATFNTADGPGDGQGWWTQSAASSASNPNMIVGYGNASISPFSIIEYRSHVSFSIQGLAGQVQSAVLRFSQQASFANGNQLAGSLRLGMFGVSTDPALLNFSGGVNPAIFEDLGSGQSYGIIPVNVTFDNSRVIELPLNAAGIAAIQNGSIFSVGLAVQGGTGSQKHYLFGNSGLIPNPWIHELVVTTIPEPTSCYFVLVSLITCAMRRSRRRS
jgi:hypothetical protein